MPLPFNWRYYGRSWVLPKKGATVGNGSRNKESFIWNVNFPWISLYILKWQILSTPAWMCRNIYLDVSISLTVLHKLSLWNTHSFTNFTQRNIVIFVVLSLSLQGEYDFIKLKLVTTAKLNEHLFNRSEAQPSINKLLSADKLYLKYDHYNFSLCMYATLLYSRQPYKTKFIRKLFPDVFMIF